MLHRGYILQSVMNWKGTCLCMWRNKRPKENAFNWQNVHISIFHWYQYSWHLRICIYMFSSSEKTPNIWIIFKWPKRVYGVVPHFLLFFEFFAWCKRLHKHHFLVIPFLQNLFKYVFPTDIFQFHRITISFKITQSKFKFNIVCVRILLIMQQQSEVDKCV